MLLRRTTNPRTIVRFASMCLLVFFALTVVARLTTTVWVDILDGVRGMMLGLTLTLLAVAGLLKRRAGGDGGAAHMRDG